MVVWGMAVIMLCYSDRVNISIAIVHMAEEKNWTMSERAAPMSAFFYGYIVSQLPASWFGRKVQYECSVHQPGTCHSTPRQR